MRRIDGDLVDAAVAVLDVEYSIGGDLLGDQVEGALLSVLDIGRVGDNQHRGEDVLALAPARGDLLRGLVPLVLPRGDQPLHHKEGDQEQQGDQPEDKRLGDKG